MNINMIIIISLIAIVLFAAIVIIIKLLTKGKTKAGSFYSKSRIQKENLGHKLRNLFSGKALSGAVLEDLEDILIKADIGPRISSDLIVKRRFKVIL